MPLKIRIVFSFLLASSVGAFAWGNVVFGQAPSMSRDMQLGVYYFKKGEDSQAMDRFIEVLNQGSPAERSQANHYLNRITQRMTDQPKRVKEKKPQTPSAVPAVKPSSVVVPTHPPSSVHSPQSPAAPKKAEEENPTPPKVLSQSEPASPQENPALLKDQIERRIKEMAHSGLRHLRAFKGISIVPGKGGRPFAIAVPSNKLFGPKITFQSGADKIIKELSTTLYGEGRAKMLIFPEGAVLGDVKVLNMRRAVAIADALVASGIAPNRVQAELLTGSSYRIPPSLLEFKGLIFIFVYNEPSDLKAPPDEEGPPLSLGISSARLRVDKGEGSLIEFSVEEPASGVRFWKFKILRQASNKEDVVEEVSGSGPVFHQVYWNGRKDYSGPPQPYGSYECLLIAEDGSGRERAIHRWIELKGPLGESAKAKTSASVSALPAHKNIKRVVIIKKSLVRKSKTSSRAPIEKSLKGKKRIVYVELRSQKTKKRASQKMRNRSAKKKALPLDEETLLFKPKTYQLTKESQKRLLLLARKMAKSKKTRYDITGYAKPLEKNAKNLCRLRAQVVAGLLLNKYRISIKRLRIKTALSAAGDSRVVVKARVTLKKAVAKKKGRKKKWSKKS